MTLCKRCSFSVETDQEGEERVEWELGFALFLSEKMGLALLGLGYLKAGVGRINTMGLGYINHKKVNTIMRF